MRELWAAHCRSPIPIRCRGALHFYGGIDPDSDEPRVLVMAPRIPPAEARARLSNMARLHRLVAGDHVPDVVAADLEAATPWLTLDCDAVADLESVNEFIDEGGDRIDYRRGAALGKTIMEVLARCHRIADPESGRPVCLGSLGAGNLLFNSDGKLWLVGFGAGAVSDAHIAPEVALGGPKTPGADVFAVMLFLRGLLGSVDLPPALQRVFAGHPLDGEAELWRLLIWSNSQILGMPPAQRPDMDAALAQARHLWRLLGFEPDTVGFAAWMARALATDPERLADAPPLPGAPRIRLGRDGEWLETPNGVRHSLAARRPLRRLLVLLAEARRARAGTPVTVEELLQAGWPGENPLPEAGSNRVYVAISTLRKLGLGELLQRWDGGYRIDPAIHCQV